MDEELKALQDQAKAEGAVVEVLRAEVADVGFLTVARAKARLRAYEKVSESYHAYIETQAELLKAGTFATSPFKELGIARIIAQWLVESEAFFKEVEPLLNATERKVRKGYLEESFERLPADVKAKLLEEFNKLKQELLIKFVGMVQKATSEMNKETS